MSMRFFVTRFISRLTIVAVVSYVLIKVPLPEVGSIVSMRSALVVSFAVVATGVVLYNTLYHDRYVP